MRGLSLVLDSIQAAAAGHSCRWLTAEQAANYLGGLNHRTVTRWAREGYVPAYPIGEGKRRLWRFLEGDLEAWMLARCSTSTLTVATDAPIQEKPRDW